MRSESRGSSHPPILNERGFTLLEVIIAMTIMLFAFTSILAVQSSSLNASARAKQMNIVAMLARNKMIEMEQKFEGKPFEDVKKEDHGTFEAPFEDYAWDAAVKEIKFPALNFGTAKGDKESGGQTDMATTFSRLIAKFFSKAMREVAITIHWKRGTADQTFTVSQYWVDLNHEFEISE